MVEQWWVQNAYKFICYKVSTIFLSDLTAYIMNFRMQFIGLFLFEFYFYDFGFFLIPWNSYLFVDKLISCKICTIVLK